MNYFDYLKGHKDEKFWQEILNTPYFSLEHKYELLKSSIIKN